MRLQINTDGGGQPGNDVGGPVACAYVVEFEGMYLGSRSLRLLGTNNEGEYMGVLSALRDIVNEVWLPMSDITEITFVADSQLIVYHITGDWKCRNAKLRVYLNEILDICSKLPFPVTFNWVRREKNKNADQLCTATMVHGAKTDFNAPIPNRPSMKAIREARNVTPWL